MKKSKGSALALLPLLIFMGVYLGGGIILNDFYAMSVLVPGLIAAVVALFMNRKKGFEKSLETFCKGAGHSDIILMVFIFILAGVFAQVAKSMGAVEATVNLGLTVIPSNILVAGIFVIAAFIAISLGTSMGTIAAVAPIAVEIAAKTGLATPLIVGAVVGGAMFGDNLSMISDTTIAATKTQGCEMRDKFKTNFKVVLPAAILAIIIYVILGSGAQVASASYDFNLIKVIPYVGILIAALLGVNVIMVLTGGIVLASGIGFLTNSLTINTLLDSVSTGIAGMSEIIIISLLIGGIVSVVKENGGIDFVLNLITSKIKTKTGAELGIGALVGVVDACTANNTIAIVTVGPIAKNISNKYGLESTRIAGILDMCSCAMQGIIPYGAQLLSAAAIASVSPIQIMQYLFYPYLMGICAIAFIIVFKSSKAKNSKLEKELA